MDKLKTRCEHCQKKIVYEERFAGRKVTCPACSQPVVLDSTKTRSDLFIDPFAGLADEPGDAPKVSSSASSTATADSEPRSTSKPRPREHSQLPSATQPDNSSATRFEESTSSDTESHLGDESNAEAPAFDDPYIDEFGLADLDLNDAATPSQPKLPPVSKDFIRKKPRRTEAVEPTSKSRSAEPAKTAARSDVAAKTFRSDSGSPSRGHRKMYVILLLTLLPLMLSIVARHRSSHERQLAKADDPKAEVQQENEGEPRLFDEAGDPQQDDVWDEPAEAEPEIVVGDADDVFDQLPGHRVPKAFLARDSGLHWVFAGLSGVGFLAVFTRMFRRFRRPIGMAVVATVSTAVLGIVMLLCFQGIAYSTTGFWLLGRSFVAAIFLIFKFIGFSYRCALEEGNGFLLSFVAYTCGVGLCVEICKLLPVIRYLKKSKRATWHGACLVGLASGVGFGVAQGIIYSSRFDNGIAPGDVYLVRFITCVALHAVWSGTGAVLLYFNQDSLHDGFSFTDFASTILMTQGISILFHGLYDTLLKQSFPMLALLVGVASIGWLIYVLERLAREEDLSEISTA